MKNLLGIAAAAIFLSFMIAGCVVAPGPGGIGVELVPPLPVVVELGAEPYYYQNGYHYHYTNDRWQYSTERNGPRSELPRSHWPKEIRHREMDGRGGQNRPDHDRR